jgi:DNA-directed RNA polymerase sigma subunit (sigma70/sigma32)
MAEHDLGRIRRAQAKVQSRVDSLQAARKERQQAIQQALDSGETLERIGRVLGVSRQRVKQLAEGQ